MDRVLIIGLCAALGACAAVPRTQAVQLAQSGATASDLAAQEVRDLSGRLDRQEELMAFTTTWETCVELPDPTQCEPMEQSDANAQEVGKLIRAINLRAEALTALADAYRALGQEAQYNAEGAMETVVGRLTRSVNAYADVIDPGAGTLVNAPLGQGISMGAGLLARDRQRTRLRDGSARIRAAVVLLRTSLGAEVRLFDALSGSFAEQEGATIEALYAAGLISRSPLLAQMATDLGVTMAPEAEQVLATDLRARGALQAYVRGQANDRVRLQAARYDAILNALAKLEAAHADFETVGGADIADLNRAIGEITALIPATKEAGQ
ncbi:hypothetical protein [Brevundimonas sp.]|uniref:hypothetical protein n=1 Tax=Brevundimonas sp. TaxID=1871086 RepID=UPI003F712BA9